MAAGDKAYWADIQNAIYPPLCRLVQQAAQNLASGTAAALQFGAGSEEVDTHGFHDTSTNNTRITPTVAGWYRLTGTANFANSTYTQILVVFRKNGTNIDPIIPYRPDAASAAAQGTQVTATASANGSTDYFELITQQNSGGAQNTNTLAGQRCVFEAEFIRPL